MQSRSEHATPPEASDADWRAWASVPWSPLTDPNKTTPDTPDTPDSGIPIPIAWHKSGVPYLPSDTPPLALQTLDVWLPNPTSTTTTPSPSTLPHHPGTWIIYIHGGAWRDPAITAASFTAAATSLLLHSSSASSSTSPTKPIAGLISLNYRLSPHPSHPSPGDPSRQAAHPDHIADVLAALSFLHRLRIFGEGERWILAGHSCGATLAFQAVMSPTRWGLSSEGYSFPKPAAIVGFNGLYDLAGFVAHPPAGYAHLREGYREFTEGAFGGDGGVWRAVCPTTAAAGWVGEWVEGLGREGEKAQVVLVQSLEDTLVPGEQLEGLRVVLEREGEKVVVGVEEAGGDHNEIWEEGGRMGEILWKVAGRL